jgi:hypothetical protein
MQPLLESTFAEFEGVMDRTSTVMTDARTPIQEAGAAYEEFVENLRGHAILYLVVDAKPERFFSDLIVSGYAWRECLQRAKAANHRDYCSALSNADSFFDAIAGDHIPLALEVFDLAAAEWMKGDEYEETFCWVRFMGLFAKHGNAAGAELDAVLERFETALEGIPSGRLEVCRALRTEDKDAFEVAFAELHEDWEQDCFDVRFRAEEEPLFAATSQIFVEGLAVLRLAQREGIPMTRTLRGCPALARRPRKKAPIDDPFGP